MLYRQELKNLKMERIENIYEVTKKLIGNINPQGESHIDTNNYSNLEQIIELAESIIDDIVLVSQNKTRYEASMKKAGLRADQFLQQLKEQLSYY